MILLEHMSWTEVFVFGAAIAIGRILGELCIEAFKKCWRYLEKDKKDG